MSRGGDLCGLVGREASGVRDKGGVIVVVTLHNEEWAMDAPHYGVSSGQ